MAGYQLIEMLRSGELTLPEYLGQVEARFLEVEPSIHALIPEENRFRRLKQDANSLMNRYPDLIERPLWFGALIGVKDIFRVDGFAIQAGSRLPTQELQGKEAESVTRLKEAGALVLGMTVTTEFAYFTPGPTRNPHNPRHTPGGSSSGSAAAVAAEFCNLALGTQTIGSIIRPASFCGVVGLKPTYDRISREGMIPLSPSLDHVGFFVPDLEGAISAARVLYRDWDEPSESLIKPRLGIPIGPYLDSVSAEGLAHFENIQTLLVNSGYELQPVPIMPDFADIRTRHQLIMSAEAAQVHAEWFKKYGGLYSPKLTELIRLGQGVSDSELQEAFSRRDGFRADLRRSFLDHNIDLYICPSTIASAPPGIESTGDPVLNLPWTQAGLPALNLPAGKNDSQLPMGLQVVGNWYKDESLLLWAKDLEKVLALL